MKPCPFCGAESYTVLYVLKLPWIWYRRVECKSCEASGPLKIGKARAMSAWNERAAVSTRAKA